MEVRRLVEAVQCRAVLASPQLVAAVGEVGAGPQLRNQGGPARPPAESEDREAVPRLAATLQLQNNAVLRDAYLVLDIAFATEQGWIRDQLILFNFHLFLSIDLRKNLVYSHFICRHYSFGKCSLFIKLSLT